MTDEQDPVTDNPLTQPEDPPFIDGVTDQDAYRLTEVVRGRMLCIVHGRACYRRVSIVGESEWVCPDERHRKSTRST